jgi:uncharacterized protein (DUF58 family)
MRGGTAYAAGLRQATEARGERLTARADRLRQLLRPPRRLRVLRPGGFLILGTLVLGLATLNTGNNLLYLLLGALLGTIALSGWLSEQALQHVAVHRSIPRGLTAGGSAHIIYTVSCRRKRQPGYGLLLRERTGRGALLDGSDDEAPAAIGGAYLPVLEPDAAARCAAAVHARRRGVVQLAAVELSTSFPFGLFSKGRDLHAPGTLVIWPRTDRPVRPPRLGGSRGSRQSAGGSAAAGAERGEFRGLREYRTGDDPRDIHWRSTARRGELITREYDRDTADEYWIVLDTCAPDAAAGEAAVEIAATLVAGAAARGDRVGLAAGAVQIEPGPAAARVDRALDALAAVALTAHGPGPRLPAPARACVLVTARAPLPHPWGDVYGASAPGQP